MKREKDGESRVGYVREKFGEREGESGPEERIGV